MMPTQTGACRGSAHIHERENENDCELLKVSGSLSVPRAHVYALFAVRCKDHIRVVLFLLTNHYYYHHTTTYLVCIDLIAFLFVALESSIFAVIVSWVSLAF